MDGGDDSNHIDGIDNDHNIGDDDTKDADIHGDDNADIDDYDDNDGDDVLIIIQYLCIFILSVSLYLEI